LQDLVAHGWIVANISFFGKPRLQYVWIAILFGQYPNRLYHAL